MIVWLLQTLAAAKKGAGHDNLNNRMQRTYKNKSWTHNKAMRINYTRRMPYDDLYSCVPSEKEWHLDFIVVEPPTCLLGRSTISAIPDVPIIIRWSCLHRGTRQHRKDADADGTHGHCWWPWVIKNIETYMAVAVDMRMHRRYLHEYDLRCLHRIVFRKINLQMKLFALVQSIRSSIHLDDPSLQTVGNFMLKSAGSVHLPLSELFLQPIRSNPTKDLLLLAVSRWTHDGASMEQNWRKRCGEIARTKE